MWCRRLYILIYDRLNGAYNIVKKAKPEAFDGRGGCALHPLRLRTDKEIINRSNGIFYWICCFS